MGDDTSTTASRRVRTPSADVERELVSAAEAVLARSGPEAVTVRAVSAEAGVSPMGVYNRFGGKDGLVETLLTIGFDRLREAVESVREEDMLALLRGCGMSYRSFALENPHFYAIMFGDAIPHLGSAAVDAYAKDTFGAIVRLVGLAAAAGVISADDPTEVAQELLSTLHGAVALELRGLVQTPDPAGTYRALLETLLRGLAPSPEINAADR